ncbi:unnamed protein product [Adineta steineri]|uniref:F-box domain-containing protein n=1 Tax=Adineta steineri TaxID=433720 RepID=A0A814CHT1_9BILA|nr:unnamed protein product [Adineta steineri]CAF0941625.1 unnamed protein product [Adineta steineri]CAF3714345.1 unnamed protein product [Adineta steineri]CAF3813456.1 unnamed protein product [Adineta steineri]
MNEINVRRLEDLPVEILFEIFKYLKPEELYSSMAHLNIRMNMILKKQPNLKISIYCLKPALSFFDSFTSLTIRFDNRNKLHLYQFQYLNLINLRSLNIDIVYYQWWTVVSEDELNTFITPDRCPLLKYLRLSGCTTKLTEFIFTGAFPYLKKCIIKNCQEFFSTSSTTSTKFLRYLHMHSKNESDFHRMLSMCPKLQHLHFHSDKLPSTQIQNIHYPLLKCLSLRRLKNFLFHNGEFDIFLSYFPNLINFNLTVDHSRNHDEIIDFAQVADCLHRRIPRLKKLKLNIYLCRTYPYQLFVDQFPLIAQMHELFRSINKCDSLIYIRSFDFNPLYMDYWHYIRPASEPKS